MPEDHAVAAYRPVTSPRVDSDVRPLTPARRVVARRMGESARTIPAMTLQREVPFAPLLERRRELGDRLGAAPSIDALVAGDVAHALREYDLLNASFIANPPAVNVHPDRNIAIAVDTSAGLVSLVIRRADENPDEELGRMLATMVRRALARSSLPEDLEGATFTITNLGAYGVESFSPIITPPQAAVLGIGAVRPFPAAARPAVLSLTFDHRIVDGPYAARFLARVAERIGDSSARPQGVSEVPLPTDRPQSLTLLPPLKE